MDAGMTDVREIPEAMQWHEGMLLAPQHFQQLALRHEALVYYHAYTTASFYWGVRRLTIDQALLVSGTLRVLKQVEPLRKLFETRQRLSDLLTKLDGNDALDALLQEGATDNNSLQELKDQVGSNDAADGEESA